MTLFSMADQDKTFNALCDSLGCENNTPGWPDQFGRAISAWLAKNKVEPIKTLSLFSGAGGLDIGFSDAGFDIAASVEIERKVCDTLELNTGKGKYFEHSKVNCVDVRAFTGDDLGTIDFIIGGPPCQTFSAAGRRANGVLGTADARGNLFREYVRLLKTLSPKGFLFENVYGIVGAQNGKAWNEILQAFSAVGYKLFYRILDAADYGVPQHRERLIIVGLKEGVFQFPRPTHGPDSVDQEPFYNAGTAVNGVDEKQPQELNRLKGRYAALLDPIPPGLNYSFYTEEMGHPNPIFAWRSKFSDFLYKADPNEPVRTIKASGGAYTGPFHWENRFFSYEEYKRLQTFPDSYQISGGKKIAVQQIGNSVPPQLARILALAIRQQVFGTEFPFVLPLLEDNEELSFRKRKRDLAKAYRKKAELAIKDIRQQPGAVPRSKTYFCTIDKTFRFQETNRDEADYQVAVSWGGKLRIELQDLKKPAPIAASIQITPANRLWALEVERVELIVRAALRPGFTVAWKAFEQELIANGIKADLVQLNGYYQYPPKLHIDAQIFDEGQYAGVLKSVLSYHGVPEILTSRQLAEQWQISEQEVIPAAEFLKDLGYEIRNHCTNSQIEQGSWLIPYAFPTLTPLSVQLWKKLKESETPNMPNNHLDVYEDRCELHQDERTMVFYQGFQNEAAQRRYTLIQQTLKAGYLEQVIASVATKDVSELSEENRTLLRTMVDGITSEVGRALVGLVCLQLTIKSIAPEQSVRLHKGSTIRGRFSWVDGISMRSLDKNYNTPFLRKHGLLNVNRDGVFMTRSLAENYPYSTLYKAEMKGPFHPWIAIVDAIENNTMPPELGLYYLLALLQNRSAAFQHSAQQACSLTKNYDGASFAQIKQLITTFFSTTDYSARAFEVTLHGLYQAMDELKLLGAATVVPMSQMRSANKKHGNVGDIELMEGGVIVEAWDAKYGKPYLKEELEELRDKLLTHPDVKLAGFVCDGAVENRENIAARKKELELETRTELQLLSFDEWIDFKLEALTPAQKDELAYRWLVAIVESFAQKRLKLAPIDEPCDAWIKDWISLLN